MQVLSWFVPATIKCTIIKWEHDFEMVEVNTGCATVGSIYIYIESLLVTQGEELLILYPDRTVQPAGTLAPSQKLCMAQAAPLSSCPARLHVFHYPTVSYPTISVKKKREWITQHFWIEAVSSFLEVSGGRFRRRAGGSRWLTQIRVALAVPRLAAPRRGVL